MVLATYTKTDQGPSSHYSSSASTAAAVYTGSDLRLPSPFPSPPQKARNASLPPSPPPEPEHQSPVHSKATYLLPDKEHTLNILYHAARHSPSHGITFIERSSDLTSSATTRFTYDHILQHCSSLASALRTAAQSSPSNPHVVLAFDGRQMDFILTFWACLLAGLTPTLLGPLNGTAEQQAALVHHLDSLFAQPLWIARSNGGRAGLLHQLAPALRLADLDELDRALSGTEDRQKNAQPRQTPSPDYSNQTAAHVLTSGSSGTPKAAVLSHSNIFSAAQYKRAEFGLDPAQHSIQLSWIGIDHAAGLVEAMITPMSAGIDQIHCAAALVIESPKLLLDLVSKHRVTHTFAPNFLVAKLCDQLEAMIESPTIAASSGPPRPHLDLTSLRRFTSGGESVPRKTAARFLNALEHIRRRRPASASSSSSTTTTTTNTRGVSSSAAMDPILPNVIFAPGFGMTETCAGCAYEHLDLDIVNAPGFVLNVDEIAFTAIARFDSADPASATLCPGAAHLRVVDVTGAPLSPLSSSPQQQQHQAGGRTVEGQLEVKGPSVFSDYYGMPEQTRGAFVHDSWFRTGDLALIRDEGSAGVAVYLTGRAKETIIINGISYHASQLEAAIVGAPGLEPSYTVLTAFRQPNAETESVAVFYLPTFDHADDSLAREETRRWISQRLTLVCSDAPRVVLPCSKAQMEKSTLGKLSRAHFRRLLESGEFDSAIEHDWEVRRQGVARAFRLPETDTERAVWNLAAQALALDKPEEELGTDASFFDLGATSIEVIRYRSSLLKLYPGVLTPANFQAIKIMEFPSVRKLAAYIDSVRLAPSAAVASAEEGRAYQPLVPLNEISSSGSLSSSRHQDPAPIFMVHPGVGEVLIFVNLARSFIGERPFYALRARGFEPGQTPFDSFDDMVDTYTVAIASKQPHGPIALAGYSYGGVVAFSIAKRLEAQGRTIAFLGLINIPPHIKARMDEITYAAGLLNLAYFLQLIDKRQAVELEAEIDAVGSESYDEEEEQGARARAEDQHDLVHRAQILRFWSYADKARAHELDLCPSQFQAWVDIAQSLIACGRQFTPSGSVARATIFYATPLRGTKRDWVEKELAPWQGYVRDAVKFIEVDGEHYTLMDADHVDSFQAHFRRELLRAGL